MRGIMEGRAVKWSLLPENAGADIGFKKQYGEPIEVEKGAIRKYAYAVMTDNPLYLDENYARSQGHGSVLAPPLFLCGVPPKELLPVVPEDLTVVHGEDDWELFRPVHAGDVIRREGRLVDITERSGRTGSMVFVTTETDFINQRGERVARYRATSIFRPKPKGA